MKGSFAPSLAAWTASWRALMSDRLTSFIEASAVCTIEIAVSELEIACCSPEVCARRRSEICRFAGESAPRLIFIPELSRSMVFAPASWVFVRLRCTLSAIGFVLIRRDMGFSFQ